MQIITVQFLGSALEVLGARVYPIRPTGESYCTGHVPKNAVFFGVVVKDAEDDSEIPPMPMGWPKHTRQNRGGNMRLAELIDRLGVLYKAHGDIPIYARDSLSGFEERVREVSAQTDDDKKGMEVIIEY